MLQITVLRQNKELVIEGLKKKNFKDINIIDQILELDEQYRKINAEVENFTSVINKNNDEIGRVIKTDSEKVSKLKIHNEILKDKVEELKGDLDGETGIKEQISKFLVTLPNLPHESVPSGTKPEDNVVVKQTEMPDIKGKPHWDLIEEYNLASLKLGSKLTGSGFPVFIGNGVRLQRALIQYFANYNMTAGYTEYSVPHVVNYDTAYGTGQLPDKEEQMYYINRDDLYLIPTAEVPLTNIYRDEIVDNLPIKMGAYTPCFRREFGSHGKEVRGLNRVHQFDKFEIVQIVHPDKSYEALEEMVMHIEGLLKNLELPYRILRLCGGDMSFGSALTYDFEVYSRAQDLWLEVSSVSNFETFQSNRMKIRFKDGKKNRLVHTLNGSALALPSIIACLLENNQTDKGIKLPKVMATYFGNEYIKK